MNFWDLHVANLSRYYDCHYRTDFPKFKVTHPMTFEKYIRVNLVLLKLPESHFFSRMIAKSCLFLITKPNVLSVVELIYLPADNFNKTTLWTVCVPSSMFAVLRHSLFCFRRPSINLVSLAKYGYIDFFPNCSNVCLCRSLGNNCFLIEWACSCLS